MPFLNVWKIAGSLPAAWEVLTGRAVTKNFSQSLLKDKLH
jgi:hypothetical protein